jgi:lipoprotein-anchoring transpeptidase ErfK/SrfK
MIFRLLFVSAALFSQSLAQEPAIPKAVPADLADADGQYAPIPDKRDIDTIVQVQIYLDEKKHGPGNIDGALGEFGKKAASVYNQVNKIPVGNWHRLIESAKKLVPQPYTTYKIRADDFKYITPGLPEKPQDQAKQKYMGYRSVLEFVAERFHTSEDFIRSLNPTRKKWLTLKAGDALEVPNVTPFELEKLPVDTAFRNDSNLSENSVVVDIAARVAIFFDSENRVIGSFPITPGKPKFIQLGEWKITNMVSTPEFRWDKSMLETGKRSEVYYQIPRGPNSPVGIMWTGTTRGGIGLHGTASPLTIGRAESAGCVRFANWDAVRLPTLIRPGGRFIIR